MNILECRAKCRFHSLIFKVSMVLNAERNVHLISRCSRFNISECRAECRSHSTIFNVFSVDCTAVRLSSTAIYKVYSVHGVECRAECRCHSSIFKVNVFECRAECLPHCSKFKVSLILNAELNVDPTAQYSG